mgnify:CR=1 FL=1
MTSSGNTQLDYKDGTVDVPHWGISLRTIFGCATSQHDVAKRGRHVKVTLRGVYIATIQLKDTHLEGKHEGIREAADR